MTIAHDKVVPSKKPEKWKLPIVAGVAAVTGVLATLALFIMYVFYRNNMNNSDTNLFGYKWSDYCYYSQGPFPEYNITQTTKDIWCNPACPGFDAETKGCGDYVGFSELMTVIYQCLSVGGQLTVYIARTKHSFWSRRPGWTLLSASVFAQVCATLLCVYWPVSFKIDSYVGIDVGPGGAHEAVSVIMHGIGWRMAGIIWAYCLAWFLLEDLAKVYFYHSLDNDNAPDVDVQKIKRERKPFMPNTENVQPSKKKDYERKVKHDSKQLISLP